MNYQKIIEALEPMMKLAKVKMKFTEGIAVSRLLKRMQEEAALYEEQRIKILEAYGKLNEDGTAFDVPDDKKLQAAQEIFELSRIEVDTGERIKVTIDKSNGDTPFEAQFLLKLMDFIDFEVEDGGKDGK